MRSVFKGTHSKSALRIAGSVGYRRFQDGAAMTLPFEVWRSPTDTPDDPSDDVKLIPGILDYDPAANDGAGGGGSDGIFNLSTLDSPVSSAENDPFTDWIYVYTPTDTTPGTAGYDAFVGGGTAVDVSQIDHEFFARWSSLVGTGEKRRPTIRSCPRPGPSFASSLRASASSMRRLTQPADGTVFQRAPPCSG